MCLQRLGHQTVGQPHEHKSAGSKRHDHPHGGDQLGHAGQLDGFLQRPQCVDRPPGQQQPTPSHPSALGRRSRIGMGACRTRPAIRHTDRRNTMDAGHPQPLPGWPLGRSVAMRPHVTPRTPGHARGQLASFGCARRGQIAACGRLVGQRQLVRPAQPRSSASQCVCAQRGPSPPRGQHGRRGSQRLRITSSRCGRARMPLGRRASHLQRSAHWRCCAQLTLARFGWRWPDVG